MGDLFMSSTAETWYDAIIVGGGAAGMSAGLVLARCRRSVLVVDAGRPRNHAARRLHNYLTRDGVTPHRFTQLARREFARYGGEFRRGRVVDVASVQGGFRVSIEGGNPRKSRLLLLATGVVDELPPIRNARAFYGHGVHHCPYCDAWAYRDKQIAAYGLGRAGLGLACSLVTWSADVTVITDGVAMDGATRRKSARLGIAVREEKIVRLVSRRGRSRPSSRDPLGRIEFTKGPDLPVAALFFNTGQTQRSSLPKLLGCRMDAEGGVIHDKRQRTGVEGLYLAGDASKDVQFVVVAAAEGAKAGVAMNSDLQARDRGQVRG